MLCHDVKRVAYFFFDGHLDEGWQNDIRGHLERCPDCEMQAVFHRRIHLFLKKRLAPVCAPNHLKVRLTRSLRALAE